MDMPTGGYIQLQAITARYKNVHWKLQLATQYTYVHRKLQPPTGTSKGNFDFDMSASTGNYSPLMYLVAGCDTVEASRELGLGTYGTVPTFLGNYSLLT